MAIAPPRSSAAGLAAAFLGRLAAGGPDDSSARGTGLGRHHAIRAYASLVQAQGARVVLQCQRALMGLLARTAGH